MPCREAFLSGVFEDTGTGGFPVLMCCYRLAVQIKRKETGIWEDREGSKRKDRIMAVMKLHNEESEGQTILKGNVKRIVSGLLSAVTVLSAFLQPLGAYAAGSESAAYEATRLWRR